ncbi:MAG: diguanylate cyclase [Proteobacteria bacterium]|nr:diguanylate cyclase [Pseudomonadota bacterium]
MKTDNKKVILVVEDDEHTRELVCYILTKAGFQVHSGKNGIEALDVIRDTPIDLVVCDIMMPKMDGYTLRDQLMLNPSTRSLPFVFLTAKAQIDDQVKGLLTGADDYITKPFEPYVFIARVQAVLTRHTISAETFRADMMTRLLNRYSFEKEIMRELQRLERYPNSACMAYVILDDVNRIKQTYGQNVIDLVLIRFSELLQNYTRVIDILGRYGEDEFILYLPETDEAAGAETVKRLMAKAATLNVGPDGICPEFSAGIVEIPRDGIKLAVLLSRVKQAVDGAKEQGKAQIAVWDGDRDGEQVSTSNEEVLP